MTNFRGSFFSLFLWFTCLLLVCMLMCIYICEHGNEWVCVCWCFCVNMCVWFRVFVWTCVCVCVCVCVCIYVFSGIRKIDFVTTMSGQKVMMKVTLYLISFVLSTTYLVPHPFLSLTFCPSLSLSVSLYHYLSLLLSLFSLSISLSLFLSLFLSNSVFFSLYIYILSPSKSTISPLRQSLYHHRCDVTGSQKSQ